MRCRSFHLAERLRKDGLKVWFDECEIAEAEGAKRKSASELQPSALSLEAFLSAPLNTERRFIPLRLDDAPIKGSLAQFLYINWLPEDPEQELRHRSLRYSCDRDTSSASPICRPKRTTN